jgi:hypothetical protein
MCDIVTPCACGMVPVGSMFAWPMGICVGIMANWPVLGCWITPGSMPGWKKGPMLIIPAWPTLGCIMFACG